MFFFKSIFIISIPLELVIRESNLDYSNDILLDKMVRTSAEKQLLERK